ncbi:uncharacterized protein K460DRAFT_361472 [Cucurbitaria berberidis CBS 394.84]|uniref:Uncharacterized protein n=1 Tax=Cucurbitaria berberidis CBS 394.84 TaxID=1168544 RepID=A0A9P4GSH4_9PLEO|nr:uncharacterized protein K460DRAFT_361472 [Cucurbitaria berberidis CBS 394.84]KAF1850709.1 hypothetical protein K460DRAFT_361472 [Cucurbitaria berberidis CBS 394.84]
MALPNQAPETSSKVQPIEMIETKEADKNNQLSQHNHRPGVFNFFALPRELRDVIYYLYLYRPRSVVYNPRSPPAFPFAHPEDITNLFLVSRQAYEEGLQVFCRYNTVKIGDPDHIVKNLEGKLRMFPDKPGRMLQCVSREYFESTSGYVVRDTSFSAQTPAKVFILMLQDMYTFKSYFPKLRQFTAEWYAWNPFFKKNGMNFRGQNEEEKIQTWLVWMRRHVQEEHMVPPRGLRFELCIHNSMQAHENAMNEAYEILLRETPTPRDESMELEESGKRWLEVAWGEV